MCLSELMSHYTYLINPPKIFIKDLLLCDVKGSFTVLLPKTYLAFIFQIKFAVLCLSPS